ncbi:MAG: anthranilate phosphoribosyltransferase family protein [Jaaginema sp. PMC 1079.18]|nr:anthranilate phosphoribosyltransferase family protein [Jaaginema sp. PMC 1080.18]MEC4851684.1 anthranilate phosphoribosyltransferase family protein [Jaaginema sp. PMC 1079.18]MEC4868106.1 anthranilate phosphoribosyltransferase family protein [Jaaginema sp. PMC 1078.18]
MSHIFRDLLKKVGSGTHTSKDLTRSEAEQATRMMLLEEATPAQIGAFMIAHRIKRPTPPEIAGILDAYEALGPRLQVFPQTAYPVTVLGIPYDGRSRTAPISPIVALMLAVSQVPVILHGGITMPTKYGMPLNTVWQGLGWDFTQLSQAQIETIFAQTHFGFVYLPTLFPQAHNLVQYRDQIGKRPPTATAELVWSPYAGKVHLVAGYVHPPTETRFHEVFSLRGMENYTLVKGLEGSCDLPRDRTALIAVHRSESHEFEHLKLHPRDYGFAGSEVPFTTPEAYLELLQSAIANQPSELRQAAIWNGGFYLWRCGVCVDLTAGFEQAELLLSSGKVQAKVQEIREAIEQESP